MNVSSTVLQGLPRDQIHVYIQIELFYINTTYMHVRYTAIALGFSWNNMWTKRKMKK